MSFRKLHAAHSETYIIWCCCTCHYRDSVLLDCAYCTIALQVALEGKAGFVWGAALCILGSPVACAYLAWKVHQGNYGFVQGAREGSQYYT